ncbi:hypothetical protein NDU88_010538 [Pleurodeles waltl]|uniref:Uncharacterized protein n=1 Tax=Pleurodeles waltl TaxID=8319 RepID=A0AAV7S1N5_PLEWA|nr:hypothetical protein NDU88_010538 [Pleurodeles waltl]
MPRLARRNQLTWGPSYFCCACARYAAPALTDASLLVLLLPYQFWAIWFGSPDSNCGRFRSAHPGSPLGLFFSLRVNCASDLGGEQRHVRSMPPGGPSSSVEPTRAAFYALHILVSGAVVPDAAPLGTSPAPHPRAGASAVSQCPGLARFAPALALRFSGSTLTLGLVGTPGWQNLLP